MNDSMSDEWPDAPPAVSTSTTNSDAFPPVNLAREGSWSSLNAEAPAFVTAKKETAETTDQVLTWRQRTSDGKSLGFVRRVDVWGGGGGVRTSPAAHTTNDSNHSINELKPKLESDVSDDEWGPPEADGATVKPEHKQWIPFLPPRLQPKLHNHHLNSSESSNPESFKREQVATSLPTNDSAATLLSTPQLDITKQTESNIENESPTQDVDYGVEESEIYVGTLDSVNSHYKTKNAEQQDLPDQQFQSLTEFITTTSRPSIIRYRHATIGNADTRRYFKESAYIGKTASPTSQNTFDSGNDSEASVGSTGFSSFSAPSREPRRHKQPQQISPQQAHQHHHQQQVHLNMSDPFSILICGAPKSGKTHTLSILLESCLLPTWNESHDHPDSEIINTLNPMCALILHYSESPLSICPFVNLCIPITHVSLHHQPESKIPTLPDTRVVVLVSPSTFVKRREVYKSKCEARPLLFSWAKLTARQVKIFLHLDDGGCGGGGAGGDGEVAILRDLLTSYQQPFQEDGESEEDEKPLFQDFLIQVRTRVDEFRKRNTTGINNSQSNDDALTQQQPPSSQEPSSNNTSNNSYNNNSLVSQKLNILETFIAESPRNRFRHPTDFAKLIKRGILVIADLTDLKVQASANHWALTEFEDVGQVVEGVFTVLLDMFGRGGGGGGLGGGGSSSVCKKVVVVDDMDLYSKQQQRVTRGSSSCEGIMMRTLIGNMQKPGVNVLMAVSDPRVFSPECLQLASLVVMHRMGSRLWFDYLKESGGVPLRERDFFGDEHDTDENGVVGLGLGDALIYAGNHGLTKRKGSSCWKLEVRVKMTE